MNKEIKDSEWKKEESKMIKYIVLSLSCIIFIVVIFMGICFFSSCTMSFQNISTHGTATDLVDEHQTASPSTDANIPISLTSTP